jgi:hypothetical protein
LHACTRATQIPIAREGLLMKRQPVILRRRVRITSTPPAASRPSAPAASGPIGVEPPVNGNRDDGEPDARTVRDGVTDTDVEDDGVDALGNGEADQDREDDGEAVPDREIDGDGDLEDGGEA